MNAYIQNQSNNLYNSYDILYLRVYRKFLQSVVVKRLPSRVPRSHFGLEPAAPWGVGDMRARQARSDFSDARCGLPARSQGRGNPKNQPCLEGMVGVSKSGCARDPGRSRHGHDDQRPLRTDFLVIPLPLQAAGREPAGPRCRLSILGRLPSPLCGEPG
jgi:hypothetical protein